MKKAFIIIMAFSIACLALGCEQADITEPTHSLPTETVSETETPVTNDKITEDTIAPPATETEKTPAPPYVNITQEEAKSIMDSGVPCVILDVRTQSEYEQGHIPGAILIPHTEITEKAETVIPNKDTLILVYCRSGNRSKTASEYLLDLGYTNIKEFGGINDWQYDIVY